MEIFGKTDKGLVRSMNQDSFFAKKLFDDTAFAVVCDGMGGANAGNVASANAVSCISDYIMRSYRREMTEDDIERLFQNAVKSANMVIYDMALGQMELNGMGTTAVIALVRGESSVIAHVGDSRIYLLNDDIKQLTRDHSVVQSLIESGKITLEDAKIHPRKNVITRALGAEKSITADTATVELKKGDTLLLCSDGLTNYVDDADILSAFKNTSGEQLPQTLVASANENGGGDNITVVTLTGKD